MTDYERGIKALTSYHTTMRSMYPSSFRYSFTEFLSMVKQMKLGKALADGLGGAIRETSLSDYQVSASMTELARRGLGKIPSGLQDFFFALQGEATKVKFVDATLYVLTETGSDIVSGVQSVGDSILTTGKILNFLLPAILLLFVFFWLDGKSGGKLSNLAGKAGRALK